MAEVLHGIGADTSPERLQLAAQIARIPDGIRGYGHIKLRQLEHVQPQWEELMRQWRQGGATAQQPTRRQVTLPA